MSGLSIRTMLIEASPNGEKNQARRTLRIAAP